ncbi:unnamed protein product [Moneuplotes crassus]|uniref:Amine oxidase domain-containing protein n=1 Tax=Euplotes crassus TaxID=5936 RepID=A0AAD1X7W0_EUPCR|nr:unnamed protein product [Moneuplotes crassus]
MFLSRNLAKLPLRNSSIISRQGQRPVVSFVKSRFMEAFQLEKPLDPALIHSLENLYLMPYPDAVQNSENYKIAVMGGGISGLVSAFYTRKYFPFADITLYEKDKNLGGWMSTICFDKFVHELGPRSVRNNAMAVEILNVLDELKILDRVIKDKPRTMKINIVQDETLKTAQLKKWKLVWKFLQIKLKYSLDKNIQKNTHENDLTVKEFMKQFTKEDDKFVTHSIDPFLSGIWAGKISELSAKSALHVMMTFLADDRISSFPKAKPRSKRVKRYQRYLKGKELLLWVYPYRR